MRLKAVKSPTTIKGIEEACWAAWEAGKDSPTYIVREYPKVTILGKTGRMAEFHSSVGRVQFIRVGDGEAIRITQ